MIEPGLKKIETGVDRLIYYLKGKGLVDLNDVSTYLGIPTIILQKWVDFLIEDKVLGVDYKFTKPFIYLIEKTPDKVSTDLQKYKQKFETAAKEKDVPVSKTDFLWKSHMLREIDKKKAFFIQQATIRNLENIEKLWDEYKKRVGN